MSKVLAAIEMRAATRPQDPALMDGSATLGYGAIGVFATPTGLPERYSATWCFCVSSRCTAIGRMMPIDNAS